MLQLNLHDMLCEYSHTKSENLAQIPTTIAEIRKFFKGIVFIGAPYVRRITQTMPYNSPGTLKFFLRQQSLDGDAPYPSSLHSK